MLVVLKIVVLPLGFMYGVLADVRPSAAVTTMYTWN